MRARLTSHTYCLAWHFLSDPPCSLSGLRWNSCPYFLLSQVRQHAPTIHSSKVSNVKSESQGESKVKVKKDPFRATFSWNTSENHGTFFMPPENFSNHKANTLMHVTLTAITFTLFIHSFLYYGPYPFYNFWQQCRETKSLCKLGRPWKSVVSSVT